MKVLMFGPLEVHCEGTRLGASDLGGVKPKQILEMLLLRRGHPVGIDVLAEGLWPSKPPRDVPATLNTYVSVLRHHLFRDQTEARRVIFTSPKAYGFSTNGPDVDLDTFDHLVVRAERALRDEQIQLLTAAVELARGVLLEDALDDEWTREERSAYTRRLTRVHLCLAKDFLLEVAPLTAFRHADSARALSAYSEEAARLIMISNYAMGLEDASRAAYERCRRTIGDDLGLDLTSATEQLAAAINAGASVEELISDLTAPAYSIPQGRSRSTASITLMRRPEPSVSMSG
ncbi:MAG TPA: BTAD domain-containing putative transcriptional regulator [Ilumatobacteraceae bacterium]|nr:BTAD domain-containing putative transcriptional regulator [Ilumatobacteraceae bacterium]